MASNPEIPDLWLLRYIDFYFSFKVEFASWENFKTDVVVTNYFLEIHRKKMNKKVKKEIILKSNLFIIFRLSQKNEK